MNARLLISMSQFDWPGFKPESRDVVRIASLLQRGVNEINKLKLLSVLAT